MQYDEEESRRTELAYLSPEIVEQRARTIEIIQPAVGETFVDVGCGPGLLALEIATAVGPTGHVVCVDSSAPMIALAEARCKSFPNVEFFGADAANLPVDDSSTDVATCTQLLLYVANVLDVLLELHRVLKPGGRIYVMETDWRSTVVHTNNEALTEKIIEAWDAAVPNPRLPARLSTLLRTTGFNSIQANAIPLISTSSDSDGFAMTMLKQCVIEARDQQIVSKEEGRAWFEQVAELGKKDEFFFCVNRFLFAAIK